MARDRSGSVRMGPISIFTLVVVLCLAVMAVLSVTTAHADAALAERQACFTQDDYTNEIAGQTLMAGADGALATVRAQGDTAEAGTAAIRAQLNTLIERAQAAAGPDATVDVQLNGTTLAAHIEQPSKRCLDITLGITAQANLRITSWKTSTTWTEDTSDTLWMGA